MKKFSWLIIVFLVAFACGYSSVALSGTDYKIAVVDVQSLVINSSEIKLLKAEQEKKTAEINATLEKARQEIAKETDPVKIAQLEEKYRNDINNQKLALDKEYSDKLQQLDNKIKANVVTKAKEMRYNLVLPKNIVLFGGEDITSKIIIK